jgi:hypothetical protein
MRYIKNLQEYLNEKQNINIQNNDIKNILIKRIPFLKEYNIFTNPRDSKRLEAQRVVYNTNVELPMGDDIIIYPQYNVSSNIIYYPHTINDNTFHNFVIKNTFHVMPPEEMDDLTHRVFLMALKKLEDKLSYNKEVILKKDESFPNDELDIIINEMNGVLFKIEEYTDKYSISLF